MYFGQRAFCGLYQADAILAVCGSGLQAEAQFGLRWEI